MINTRRIFLFLLFFYSTIINPFSVNSAQDGVAETPPMGWRSWNYYGANIDQVIMEQTSRDLAFIRRRPTGERVVNGDDGITLAELGYTDVGLDDNWQDCHIKSSSRHWYWPFRRREQYFHDVNGSPMVNKSKFPNMTSMVESIHENGLTAGWYHNNCICREKSASRWGGKGKIHYEGDVNATLLYGFDSVKLDGCGAFRDLDLWYHLFSAASSSWDNGGGWKRNRMMMIENCHWGSDIPKVTRPEEGKHTLWCPFHMYRTSKDIQANWHSMYSNLQTTRPFQQTMKPISRPGCWAYPDMLQVGFLPTLQENRAHFGAWCITSSPLILSHDVGSDKVALDVWPIISNKDAIRINQDWAGHPGRMTVEIPGKQGRMVQVWTKPLSSSNAMAHARDKTRNGLTAFAVFVINDNNPFYAELDTIEVDLIASCGAIPGAVYNVRDVWAQESEEFYDHPSNAPFVVTLAGHDSVFVQFNVKEDNLYEGNLTSGFLGIAMH